MSTLAEFLNFNCFYPLDEMSSGKLFIISIIQLITMNYKTMLPIIMIATLGMFFLGKGITGFVVSESCCLPPNCAEENICDSGKQRLESPGNMADLSAGAAFLGLSVIFYIIMHKKHH